MKNFIKIFSICVIVGSLLGLSRPAKAMTLVDLELVLAVDVSGSISGSRFNLQQQGYVDAFNSATIYNAIQSGQHGAIAVSFVYWSTNQVNPIGWTLINDQASSQAFATAIANASRPSASDVGLLTALGDAVTYSSGLFAQSPYVGTRRVIDISANGDANTGSSAASARLGALNTVDTINGLPIVTLPNSPLPQYFIDEVIGGPDAFIEIADGFDDFGRAILAKLEVEVTPPTGGPIPPAAIPEPATLLLFGVPVFGALARKRFQA